MQSIQSIQFIPKEFHEVKLGYYESSENICTPHYPHFEFYLKNEIAINAPEKIIYNISDSTFVPVIPICGAYMITDRRRLKYDSFSSKMLHIRKMDGQSTYTGEIIDPELKYEYPSLPPNYLKEEKGRARKIEEAQKYSEDELNEGQSSGNAININLLEYVDIPLSNGIYEIYISFSGLESNHVKVEIIFAE